MSLADRLQKLQQRAARRERTAAPAPREAPAAGAGPELALPAGEERAGPGVAIRTTRLALDYRHGSALVGELLRCDAAALAAAGRVGAGLDLASALFLDTETTDLASGAGVYVFLVGVLTLGPSGAVLEQILLRAPEHEVEFLDEVAARIERAAALVTFFGKAFDRHKLDDRFALHRRGRPLAAKPHLDLYHVARRLFGAELPNCRLRTLEERVLGVRRGSDVSGADCPEIWLESVMGRDTGRLEGVLRHNGIDVVSLVTLAARIAGALAAPRGAAEAAAAGLVLDDGGAAAAAEPHLAAAVLALHPDQHVVPPAVRKAALLLAQKARRAGCAAEALRILDRLALALPSDAEPRILAAAVALRDAKDAALAGRLLLDAERRLLARPGGSRRGDALRDVRARLARLAPPAPEVP